MTVKFELFKVPQLKTIQVFDQKTEIYREKMSECKGVEFLLLVRTLFDSKRACCWQKKCKELHDR